MGISPVNDGNPPKDERDKNVNIFMGEEWEEWFMKWEIWKASWKLNEMATEAEIRQ